VDPDSHPDPDLHHFDNMDPHPDPHPHQRKIRIRIPFKVISWIPNRIRIRINSQMTSQNGWNIEPILARKGEKERDSGLK
jgi:hypothetical protein